MTYTLNGDDITLPTTGNIFKNIVSDMLEKKYPNLPDSKEWFTLDIALDIVKKNPKAKFTIGIAHSLGCKDLFSNAYLKVTADCNKKGENYRIYFMI